MNEWETRIAEWATRCHEKDATIAALQARVEALEGWQDGVVTAFREAPLEWSPDLGQGNIPSALPQIFKNMHDYATKLTQRTAELEAAKAIQAIDLKNNNAYREQVATLQAELERVRAALERIARYGNDGICPFGCDTPHIAQAALTATSQEGQHG